MAQFEENLKAFYSYVNNERLARERVDSLEDKVGNLCLDPEKVCVVLDVHFCAGIHQGEDHVFREKYGDVLGHFDVMHEDVLGLLLNIKVRKS